MTTNPIEELAKKSVECPRSLAGVPKIRHAIQRSQAHQTLAAINVIAEKGFPLIAREAFAQTYRDETYGIELPVFGFFNVLRDPVIRYEFNDPNYVGIFGLQSFSQGLFYQQIQALTEKISPSWTGLLNDTVDKIERKQLNKFFPPPFPGKEADRYHCKQVSFTAHLQHIIPEHVMALVDEHAEKKTFNEGLYIVAEVKDCWTMEQREVRMNTDPLLVGVDFIGGKSVFYLLAKFDLTPEENYITQEFIQ